MSLIHQKCLKRRASGFCKGKMVNLHFLNKVQVLFKWNSARMCVALNLTKNIKKVDHRAVCIFLIVKNVINSKKSLKSSVSDCKRFWSKMTFFKISDKIQIRFQKNIWKSISDTSKNILEENIKIEFSKIFLSLSMVSILKQNAYAKRWICIFWEKYKCDWNETWPECVLQWSWLNKSKRLAIYQLELF